MMISKQILKLLTNHFLNIAKKFPSPPKKKRIQISTNYSKLKYLEINPTIRRKKSSLYQPSSKQKTVTFSTQVVVLPSHNPKTPSTQWNRAALAANRVMSWPKITSVQKTLSSMRHLMQSLKISKNNYLRSKP